MIWSSLVETIRRKAALVMNCSRTESITIKGVAWLVGAMNEQLEPALDSRCSEAPTCWWKRL